MTIALAIRKNGRTVLAADTLLSFGSERIPPENCHVEKVYRAGSSVLAWAGWALYAELLDAYLATEAPPDLTSEVGIFSFFIRFWRAMRDDYTFMQHRSGDRQTFVSLDSTFLIANRSGIFKVSGDMNVTTFNQYCAIGSGAAYSWGALRVLYDLHDDPATIARLAAEVAIDYNIRCGGQIDIVEAE